MNNNFVSDRNITPKFGPIGYITYKRSYSRRFNENDPNSDTEEFHDTVDRVINACRDQLNVGFTPQEEKELSEIFLNLKGSVAGRFWWQLGTKTVGKLGLFSLMNCAATVIDHHIRPFTWTMDSLMLGSGVGFNIQKKYVDKLPTLKGKIEIKRHDVADADFIVPDSREGWIKLLEETLRAHFETGKGFTYSTQLVRSKGAVIKSFGGIASGPDELCWGIDEIHKILNLRSEQKLRPIDCLDIMNIIGHIVVSGNVRRSAQIAVGDYDDIEFLKAKRWDLGPIPNWRSMSNNSVICEDIDELPIEFWDTYKQGEPYGLINLRLFRECGRIGEIQYPDPDVVMVNPCSEQGLVDKETCNLAEIFLPNIESKEELIKVATYLYRINKHSLALKCHQEETQTIVNKNMRMGIGITGVAQCPEYKLEWLDDCYKALREFDVKYSKQHNFPTSIKLTTVKPSGSLSLLPGVTPGAHPSPAGPYYIRRIRIASNSPLIEICKQNGYFIEPQRNFDGSIDQNTMVVEFPCSVPEGTPIGDHFSSIEQLELIKKLQTIWSDNSVSVTVYYKLEDLEEIKQWLRENYRENTKSVSFLLYHGHGFDQAPYETISKERYEELIKNITPINSIASISENSISGVDECANGACPIR